MFHRWSEVLRADHARIRRLEEKVGVRSGGLMRCRIKIVRRGTESRLELPVDGDILNRHSIHPDC
jgi:hypothetical protein